MQSSRDLIKRGHVHRFVVIDDPDGWEVREEEDAAVLRRAHHADWHRVEREFRLFDLSADALKRQGWVEN